MEYDYIFIFTALFGIDPPIQKNPEHTINSFFFFFQHPTSITTINSNSSTTAQPAQPASQPSTHHIQINRSTTREREPGPRARGPDKIKHPGPFSSSLNTTTPRPTERADMAGASRCSAGTAAAAAGAVFVLLFSANIAGVAAQGQSQQQHTNRQPKTKELLAKNKNFVAGLVLSNRVSYDL